ncbi:MAG: TatD family hydrolase [Victivallales bacterium]|nr:TatD family hydrolase [Victivallales bacterium]
MIPLCDAHAHLADARVFPQHQALLEECRRHGMERVLVNAAQVSEWGNVMALMQREGVLGALGVHPFWPEQWDDTAERELLAHLQDPALRGRIVAIGEIGLDFWNGRDNARRQIEALARQLQIAREFHLPVCLHNRKSWEDFFGIVRDFGWNELRGYCHNFIAGTDIARRALDLGLHLSFNKPLLNPDARKVRASAAYAPLDRLLTETDSPDILPSPIHVSDILAALAQIRNLPVDAFASQIVLNFQSLFEAPLISREEVLH